MTHCKNLWPEQVEDLAVAIAQPRSMNLSEPGTGKTGTAAVLSYYYWTEHGQKSIWVQPNHLRFKNKRELLAFTDFGPDDVEVFEKATDTLGVRKRKTEPRANQHTGFVDYIGSSTAKVFVVGFTFFKTFYERMLECHPDINLVVVDEGHLGFKTNDSKATRSLYQVMNEVEGYYYMTGSPIDGRLDNVFPHIHIIEPNYYGSYRGFIRQHAGFIDDYNRVLWWTNEDKVKEILEKHSVRRLWRDIHGEQERDVMIVPVDMMPEMQKAYKEFDQMACLELDSYLLDGSNPGVATLRARQILGHPETFNLCKHETSGKDQMLMGFAEEAKDTGGGLVAYASLVPEVERNAEILRNAGLKVGMMHGSILPKVRDRIDQMFQNGELDAVSCSPAVASTGYNWQRSKHMVYTSLDYKDSNLEQSIKRGERELRDEALRVTILEYDGTVDQRIMKIINVKDALARTVLPTR
jgi:SNF2 family DNA or RNA helicase